MPQRYIVMSANAQMPSSCWGRYGKIAVVETDGARPLMISARARHCVRIVELWDKLHMGGPKSAYALALDEAKALAAKLNKNHERNEKRKARQAEARQAQKIADHIDGYDRDDLGESPDY